MAAELMAHAVRGRSCTWLGPSVYKGPADRPAVALTFDDGPSESTPQLLEVLARLRVPATFFQCGANVRRYPEIARQVAVAGHQIGNHSDTHPRFFFRSPGFILDELARAQEAIHAATGVRPAYLRVPYGARWFGLRRAQKRLRLLGVMWSVIGLDWKLRAEAVVARLLRKAGNGAIICLHDGRELQPRPDISETVEAVRRLVPALSARGFQFEIMDTLLCPTT